MQKSNVVSLWVAELVDQNALEQALAVRYSDDGDWIAPPFARAFGIERFDEATREAEVLEAPATTFKDLLEGFSYDDVLIPRFEAQSGVGLSDAVRGVVLLYDFEFPGTPQRALVGGVAWRYIGTVSYR